MNGDPAIMDDIPDIDPVAIEKMLGMDPHEDYQRYRVTVRHLLDTLRRRWPYIYAEVFVNGLVQLEQVTSIVEFDQANRLMVESEHVPTGVFGSADDAVVLTSQEEG